LDALAIDTAIFDVSSRFCGIGGLQKALMILLHRPLHGLEQTSFGVDIFLSETLPLLDHDPSSIRKQTESLGEGNTFLLHDETKDIPADIADEALPSLSFGIDLEAWSPVVVKWATRYKPASLTANIHIAPDQIDDLYRQSDPFPRVVVERDCHQVSRRGVRPHPASSHP
jgi:hypothetical protein